MSPALLKLNLKMSQILLKFDAKDYVHAFHKIEWTKTDIYSEHHRAEMYKNDRIWISDWGDLNQRSHFKKCSIVDGKQSSNLKQYWMM